MSLRKEQCNKVCRILDNVLANRPTERDSLIVAVRKAFEALHRLSPSESRKGKWIEHNPHKWGLGIVFECSECGEEVNCETCNYCPNCGAKMEVSDAQADF